MYQYSERMTVPGTTYSKHNKHSDTHQCSGTDKIWRVQSTVFLLLTRLCLFLKVLITFALVSLNPPVACFVCKTILKIVNTHFAVAVLIVQNY